MQNTSGIVGLLFSYQGRINRAKYWTAVLIYLAVNLVVVAIGFIMFGNSILALSDDVGEDGLLLGLASRGIGFLLLSVVIYIPLIVSGIFVGIKRLHDRDKSGWWLLVFYLVPALLNGFADVSSIFWIAALGISIWAFVELGCLRGTQGPNKYGSDPLAS
jgi:uncharacterized membrane protein YhaH (DUF805 family)